MVNRKKYWWLLALCIILLGGVSIWSGIILNRSLKIIPTETITTKFREPSVSDVKETQDDVNTLVVGGDNAFPPFSYLEDGEAKGLDNDLMRELAKLMRMDVRFVLTSWDEAQQNLLDGKVDVINGMAYSFRREKEFSFGTPHTVFYYDLFVPRNSKIKVFEDIADKKIIVQRGDVMEDFLRFSGLTENIILAENPLEAMKLLASEKYDGALVTGIQGYYFINEYHFSNLKGLGLDLQQYDYGYAVRKDETELLYKMNQAFAIYQASGLYDELSNRWLLLYERGSDIDLSRNILIGFFSVLLIALVVLVWVWALRRQVKSRTADLLASEKKYRQLINSAAEGIVVIKNDKIVYFNPQAGSIFGHEGEEISQSFNLLDVIHPLDRDLVFEKNRIYKNSNSGFTHLVFRIITEKGMTRWVKTNIVRIEWEGEPAALAFFTDITDEKKLEEAIRSSEERYRLVFSQSPIGMFYFDTDLKVTSVNENLVRTVHFKKDSIEGADLTKLMDQRIIPAIQAVLEKKDGYYEGFFEPSNLKKVKPIYIKLHTAPLVDEQGKLTGGIGLLEDLTSQVMIENKVKSLEERFYKVFFTSPDCISISNLNNGNLLDINRGFIETFGYKPDEVIGRSTESINMWVDHKARDKFVKGLREKGEIRSMESQLRTKEGVVFSALLSGSLLDIDGEQCALIVTRNIDDIKKSQKLIELSEKRYHTIFDTVPVSIWEQDFSSVYDMLEDLRHEGVRDFKQYLKEHPDFSTKAMKSVKILDFNNASLNIFKAKTKDEIIRSLDFYFTDESASTFSEELVAIWNKEKIFEGESVNRDINGNLINAQVLFDIPCEREDFSHILVSITDITERKNAEIALRESERRFRRLVEQVNIVVYLDHFGQPSLPLYISPQIETLLGYTPQEWLQDPELYMKVVHPDDREMFKEEDTRTDLSGERFEIEYRVFAKGGGVVWVHDEAVLEYDENGNPTFWNGVMYDITERKQAEIALRESEERYRTIFDSVPVAIKEEDFSVVLQKLEELRKSGVEDINDYLMRNPDFVKEAARNVAVLDVNEEALKLYKAESKERLLQPLNAFFLNKSYQTFRDELISFWNKELHFSSETENQTLSGEIINVLFSMTTPSTSNLSRTLVTIVDITERKRAEEQIKLQLRYLAALRAVDMAISASMDLPITLRVLLNQVTQQLDIDGADILLFDSNTQNLKYAAAVGINPNAIENTVLRLGQSYAGQAALERRIIISDEIQAKESLIIYKELLKEGYTHYMGIPLVSKGTIKGVLELFNRRQFNQDPAWMNLLESMSGQAAIAIENATLLDEVQKVNINLRSAYDATIEGWAASLEMRGSEAENHSKRVADNTIELAQLAGYNSEGLLHMRRGALLHDIGKMGVPDSILLKTEPLTDEEKLILRNHPVIGKRILNSIDFLQPAIDIPYSHHECWDGSGYPNGLSGTQIPFAARVFSIVNCWDSLRSDRPWRKAWSDNEAWRYIETNSGKIFDPQLVEKFRQMLGFD